MARHMLAPSRCLWACAWPSWSAVPQSLHVGQSLIVEVPDRPRGLRHHRVVISDAPAGQHRHAEACRFCGDVRDIRLSHRREHGGLVFDRLSDRFEEVFMRAARQIDDQHLRGCACRVAERMDHAGADIDKLARAATAPGFAEHELEAAFGHQEGFCVGLMVRRRSGTRCGA